MKDKVDVWKESILIPTYGVGEKEKYPMFLEKRVYQGSSGLVYPYPILEKVLDEKQDMEWQALFLENDYLKIMILPELGGRVQMAYDKTRRRHFIYYNEVIKPALVGLLGPWISGGIEFNWPQHHRPSTFENTEYEIQENQDGSATIWCSEIERMSGTKGMTGFTLHKDKAYLEIKVKLYNRSHLPQTFLWWANPAVAVNEHSQSIFPPDVHAVYDHGKRDVSSFPIATGTYYKVDYSKGVDISRYKNIPVPTSYMAVNSKYDFIGAYEHDTDGGLMHIANHHISTGKKQWTWGNGDFGKAWDRNLTDENGPYIELMCGVYADNQPDFSWLQPFEQKSFSQYFMPFHDIKGIKNASKELLFNYSLNAKELQVYLFTTCNLGKIKIRTMHKKEVIGEDYLETKPAKSYKLKYQTKLNIEEKDLYFEVLHDNGDFLLSYQAEQEGEKEIPQPAKEVLPPEKVKSVEQLYFIGQHLEQYRHATLAPEIYYLEALRREPNHYRNNLALGLLQLRKGAFSEAEGLLSKAIETITAYNPNPLQGDAHYYYGVSLFYQEKYDDSYDAFHKAVWCGEYQDKANFFLALINIRMKKYSEALTQIESCLMANQDHQRARHLRLVLLRKTKQMDAFKKLFDESINLDPLNAGALLEKYFLYEEAGTMQAELNTQRKNALGENVQNYLYYAFDYMNAGLYKECDRCIMMALEESDREYPMLYYLKAYLENQTGKPELALVSIEEAEKQKTDGCFPNRLEEIQIMNSLLKRNPDAPKLLYYIGNFWYSKKLQNMAIEAWERSKSLQENNPALRRNLAIAYFNKQNKRKEALEEMQYAFEKDPGSRLLMELDQLKKKLNIPLNDRLEFLEKYPELLFDRDDMLVEYVNMLNIEGKYEDALNKLNTRKFHPWEGGEGKVIEQYVTANLCLAMEFMRKSEYKNALTFLEAAEKYPENLGEGKLIGNTENDIHFYKALVYQKMNLGEDAQKALKKASAGDGKPYLAMFYNDQPAEYSFFKGMSLKTIGKSEEAQIIFQNLVDFGEKELRKNMKMDYFAVSYPDMMIWEENWQCKHVNNCEFLMALGYIGLGKKDQAKEMLESLLEKENWNIGIMKIYKALMCDLLQINQSK